MFTFQGEFSEEDYLRAQQLHLQAKGWVRILSAATLMLWLVGLIFATVQALRGYPSFFITLLPATLFILITPLSNRILLPRQIKRLFQQNKEVGAPLTIEIDEQRVNISNRFGHGERLWSDYLKWKEDEHGFLLYHSDQRFNLIPKRLLGGSEAESFVRQQLQDNQIPVAGTPIIMVVMRVMYFVLVLFAVVSMVLRVM